MEIAEDFRYRFTGLLTGEQYLYPGEELLREGLGIGLAAFRAHVFRVEVIHVSTPFGADRLNLDHRVSATSIHEV